MSEKVYVQNIIKIISCEVYISLFIKQYGTVIILKKQFFKMY